MNETLRTVISGTCGGMASILAVHPLDTVRTRLQAAPAGASPFGGGAKSPAFTQMRR